MDLIKRYVADAIKRNYKRMNNSRKVLRQW